MEPNLKLRNSLLFYLVEYIFLLLLQSKHKVISIFKGLLSIQMTNMAFSNLIVSDLVGSKRATNLLINDQVKSLPNL